jgi:hypothetical protein
MFGDPNDRNEARCLQDWESVLRIESAEKVAREQWKFHFLDSIRPASSAPISRRELLIPFGLEDSCNDVFVA